MGLWLDKLEVNVWRYRLPETTQPELVAAIVLGKYLLLRFQREAGGAMASMLKMAVVDLYLYSKYGVHVTHCKFAIIK